MGRVFDAIRKSSAADGGNAADKGNAAKRQLPRNSERRSEGSGIAGSPSAKEVEEQLFASSTIMALSREASKESSKEAARTSASSAHTADVPDGSALPAGFASRDAGATLAAP